MEMILINNELTIYEPDELEFINNYSSMFSIKKWKTCKKCKKKFPLDSSFFRREKRIHDGFENTCIKCRSGKFIISRSNVNSTSYVSNDDSIIGQYEKYLVTKILPFKKFINQNYVGIIKYLIEDKYKMKDEEILNITRTWLQEHKLYGLSIHNFNGSTIDIIEDVYPNRFKAWQFITSGTTYWNSETNIRGALEWFIEQLFKDRIISNLDEIPSILEGKLFFKYNLSGLLNIKFKSHPFYVIDHLYPNMFFEWEYNHTPVGIWTNKEDRCRALRQLLEHRLKLNIKDIPRVVSYMYFNLSNKYSKFSQVINRYYDLNLYYYINDVYPNLFLESDFPSQNHYITLDNIQVKSEPERMIHHLFMDSGLDYTYEPKTHYFLNEDYAEQYRPDWIVRHDSKIIIVEYYGMLDMNGIDFGYDEKYIRKKEYYNKLVKEDNTYIYIELILNDIKYSLDGVKNKFKQLGITLESSYY